MQAAVDNCPERMHAADAKGPRPPRIETAVEDTCQERMYAVNAEVLTMSEAGMALEAVLALEAVEALEVVDVL